MAKKDPFRPAERDTDCPKCGESLEWNKEDGLAGQNCIQCSYVFTGHERNRQNPYGIRPIKPKASANQKKPDVILGVNTY